MDEINVNNRRIAKNSIFLSIRMVVVLLISLYTTRALLQTLGIEDYGVYNVVCGFVSMFAFLNTSMSNGIQRFFNFELGKNGEEGANRVYCTSLLIQALLVFFIILLTESFGVWYLYNKMVIPEIRFYAAKWIFQFSVIGFLFIIMQAPFTAAVMAHERMGFYAFMSILDATLKLGIVFLIKVLPGDHLILYGIMIAGVSIIDFLLYYLYCKIQFSEIRVRRFFDKSLFRKMIGFSGWNLFGSFSGVMQEQGINLVINSFFGPVVNAARGVAAQINAGMESFVSSITMPVRPQVVQSYAKGDINRTMNLTYSVSKLSCGLLLLVAVPISVEIDYVLHLWLGDNVPSYTAVFTIIVLFSSLVSNLNAATSNVVHATGEMKHYQFWGGVIKISSVPLSYVVLCFYARPEFALIIVFFCRTIGHIVGLFIVKTLISFSLKEYLRAVILPFIIVLLVSVSFSLSIHFLMDQGLVRFIIVTLVGAICVSASSYYVAFDDREKQLAIQLIRSLFSKVKGMLHV